MTRLGGIESKIPDTGYRLQTSLYGQTIVFTLYGPVASLLQTQQECQGQPVIFASPLMHRRVINSGTSMAYILNPKIARAVRFPLDLTIIGFHKRISGVTYAGMELPVQSDIVDMQSGWSNLQLYHDI